MSEPLRQFEDAYWSRYAQQETFRHRQAVTWLGAADAPVADIGCGDGFLLDKLRAKGIRAWGADVSPVAIEACHKKSLDAELVDFTSGVHVPAGTKTAVLLDVLEHVYDPAPILSSLATQVDQLIISVPNFVSLPSRLQVLLGGVPENNTPRKGHVYWYTSSVLQEILRKNGWRIMQTAGHAPWSRVPVVGSVMGWLAKRWPSFWSLSLMVRACRVDPSSKIVTKEDIDTESQKDHATLWRMFWVAVAIRLALLVVLLATRGASSLFFPDTEQYVGLAQSLISGHGFALNGFAFAYRTPGYPLIVAFFLGVFRNLVPLSLVQIVLSSTVPFFLFQIGRELGMRRRIIFLAGWISVIEPHLVFYSLPILADTVFLVLFLGFVLSFIRFLKRPSHGLAIIAGACFGAGLFVKPLFQLFLPVLALLPIVVCWKTEAFKKVLTNIAILLCAVAIFTVPWMIHNQRTFGTLALSSQGGLALSDYLVPAVMSVDERISFDTADQKRTAYVQSTYGISREGHAEPRNATTLNADAARYLFSHPVPLVRVLVTNTVSFWTSTTYGYLLKRYDVLPEPPTDIVPPSHLLAQGRYGEFLSSFAHTVTQPFWLTVFLGRILWGVICVAFAFALVRHLWRKGDRWPHAIVFLLTAYFAAVIWVEGFGIDARLRLPFMPLMILYACELLPDGVMNRIQSACRWVVDRVRRFGRRIRDWHRDAPMRTWIVLASFLVVVLYAFIYRIPPHVDARRYFNVASNLVTKGIFCETCDVPIQQDTAIHGVGPGYQFFLAGIFKLFGIRLWVVWIIQAVMHAVVVAWLWALMERMAGRDFMRRRIALLPLALFAFHPDLVQNQAMLLTESLFIFLLMACVKVFLSLLDRLKQESSSVLRSGAWLGALLGLLTMVRPTGLPLFVCVVAVLLWNKRIALTVMMSVLFIAVQVPWNIRNLRTYDHVVYNSVVGGLDVWVGLYPKTSGEFDYASAPEIQQKLEGLNADQIDAVSLQEAKKIVVTMPGFAMLRTIQKGFKLFALSKTSGFWFHYHSQMDQLATVLGSIGFNLMLWIMAFGSGFALLWTRRASHPLVWISAVLTVLLSVSPILTVVINRYRIPLLPFAALLAADFLAHRRGRVRRNALIAAAVFLVVATSVDAWGQFPKIVDHLHQLFG